MRAGNDHLFSGVRVATYDVVGADNFHQISRACADAASAQRTQAPVHRLAQRLMVCCERREQDIIWRHTRLRSWGARVDCQNINACVNIQAAKIVRSCVHQLFCLIAKWIRGFLQHMFLQRCTESISLNTSLSYELCLKLPTWCTWRSL